MQDNDKINNLSNPPLGEPFESDSVQHWLYLFWEALTSRQGATPLGTGAAATLGTIGQQGPQAAAQACWVKQYDDKGRAYYLPAWR